MRSARRNLSVPRTAGVEAVGAVRGPAGGTSGLPGGTGRGLGPVVCGTFRVRSGTHLLLGRPDLLTGGA